MRENESANIYTAVLCTQFDIALFTVPQNQLHTCSGVPKFCLGGGVQQIQLRTYDKENGDLGAVAP